MAHYSKTRLDQIIESMRSRGGEASLDQIYRDVELQDDKALTSGQQGGIRKEIEKHSSDSDNWERYGRQEDLFYSVGGLGSGVWGLKRMRRARA